MPKRVDENQKELVQFLRQIGAKVESLHTIGHGVPDLLIGYRGKNYLVEVKNPNKPKSDRVLTPAETEWHLLWRGQVAIIETTNDLEILLGLRPGAKPSGLPVVEKSGSPR